MGELFSVQGFGEEGRVREGKNGGRNCELLVSFRYDS